MPELPEVEEVRRTLEPFLLGHRVTAVDVRRADFVTPLHAPLRKLVGHEFVQTMRHGKKLFTTTENGQTLVVHLGMSGRVDCVPHALDVPKHTHVILTLATKTDIRFRDPRRFGGISYYSTLDKAKAEQLAGMGPDALSLTANDLSHWRTSSGRLKARLLSQKDVAGLGNIYVDEVLWLMQLHPLQRVDRIRPELIPPLVTAIHETLNKSIRSGGTTLRDYRNVSDQPGEFARQLQAYGRGGEPCHRCGTTLKSQTVVGRTTIFCPTCQRCR